MNVATQRQAVAGPAGALECAVDTPAGTVLGTAVLCHPHPVHGGTMDNKVVQTMARALVALGWRAVRFNFRGVGASSGVWDEGQGEVDDALAVIEALHVPGTRLLLGGFSFGAYVASQAAERLRAAGDAPGPERLLLIGPAVQSFAMAPVPPDTVVIQGETDDVVPMPEVLAWARTQSLPVTVLPAAGHFFHGQLPMLKQIISAALR
jgi:uncharacterized protein